MGPAFDRPGAVHEVCDAAYRGGLLMETAGPHDEVAKTLPPLTVADGQLEQGRGCSTRPSPRWPAGGHSRPERARTRPVTHAPGL